MSPNARQLRRHRQARRLRRRPDAPIGPESTELEDPVADDLPRTLRQPPAATTVLALQRALGNRAVNRLLPGRVAQRQAEAGGTPPAYPGHLLRYGSQGEAVRQLQTLLNGHGHGLNPDGIFGSLTQQAVITFQQSQGLAVDGLVGPQTWQALTGTAGPVTETPPGGGPPGSQPVEPGPVGLDSADLQALAASLTAAGQAMLLHDPVNGAQALAGAQVAAGQLLSSSAGEALLVQRQPAQEAPAATTAGSLDFKQALDNLLQFVVNDMGNLPQAGPPGSQGDPVRGQALFLDAIFHHVSGLKGQAWPGTTGSTGEQAEAELALFLRRVQSLRGFYNSLLPTPAFVIPPAPGEDVPGALPGQRRPGDPRRQQLVGNALADLGKVKAKEKDSTGRRIGHQHLRKIFDTAWPSHGMNPIIFEKAIVGPKLKHGGKIDNPADWFQGDLLPSWCGVGATYWAKQAIPDFPDWVSFTGVTHLLEARPKTELPEVGDLVASTKQGHHGIISWVDPGASPPQSTSQWQQVKVKTVEANINGEIVETPSGHDTLVYWNVGVFKPYRKSP